MDKFNVYDNSYIFYNLIESISENNLSKLSKLAINRAIIFEHFYLTWSQLSSKHLIRSGTIFLIGLIIFWSFYSLLLTKLNKNIKIYYFESGFLFF